MMRFNLPLIAILFAVWNHVLNNVSGNKAIMKEEGHHHRRRRPRNNRVGRHAASSTSGDEGDDGVVQPRRSLQGKGKGKGKGKGTPSSGEDEEEFEFVVEEDSNDGSFLVYLCDLFDNYAGRDCTVDGQVLEQPLLCPDGYEQSKICDALAHNLAATRTEAVTVEYCEPLFMGWNVNRPDDATINDCIGSCVDFLGVDDECCVLPC